MHLPSVALVFSPKQPIFISFCVQMFPLFLAAILGSLTLSACVTTMTPTMTPTTSASSSMSATVSATVSPASLSPSPSFSASPSVSAIAPWPMYGQNQYHTSLSSYYGPSGTISLRYALNFPKFSLSASSPERQPLAQFRCVIFVCILHWCSIALS